MSISQANMTSRTLPIAIGLAVVTLAIVLTDGCERSSSTRTAQGHFEIELSSDPDPVPLNEMFRLSVRVRDVRGSHDASELVLAVDATMPGHNHGMNVAPSVSPGDGAGHFVVEGMLFHMPGRWEITVHVKHDELTDVATFPVEL